MTKRIFAVVLALVLSLSIFAIPTFAADTIVVSADSNDKGLITASWAYSNSALKEFEVRLFSSTGEVTAAKKTVTSNNYSYTVSASGNYTIQVTALDAAGVTLGSGSAKETVSINNTVTSTDGKLTFNRTGTDVTVSWSAPAGVTGITGYTVSYSYGSVSREFSVSAATTSFPIKDVPTTSAVSVTVYYATSAGGNKAGTVGSGVASVTGSTGNNNTTTGTTISVTGGLGTATYSSGVLTWTKLLDNYPYTISYYLSGNSVKQSTTVFTNSWTVPTGTTSATIECSLGTVCSVKFNNTGTTSDGIFNINYATRTITWNAVSGASYYNIYINGQSTKHTTTAYPSFTAPTGAYTVKVEAVYPSGWTSVIGTATLTGSSSGSTSGNTGNNTNHFTSNGLTISKGANYSTVTWKSTAGKVYLVTYKKVGDANSTQKIVADGSGTIQLNGYTYNDTWTVSVVEFPNNNSVGSVTVYPTGSTGSTNTAGTVTTNGTNCTVVSTATSATVTWKAANNSSFYTVIYTVGNTSKSTTVTGTTATIPVGHANAFTVIVADSSYNMIGTCSVKQSSVGTSGTTGVGNATTKIDNLKLESGSWTTTVSWNKVSGASFYQILYAPYGSTAGETVTTTNTSISVPFGKGSNFEIYVYSVTSGNVKEVGSAVYIAGTTPSTGTSSDDLNVKDDAYKFVTDFKATQANKTIKLTWTAAEDCDTYTIYWRRNGSTEWKKAGTTKKCAVNIKGLTNGVKYDFKVVSNGYDSGIINGIAPHATNTGVVTARDPEGASEIVSENPVITSATGGNGTATIKWDKVEDATQYSVWFANSNSNKYSKKATIDNNAVIVSGLSAGTYKVDLRLTLTANGPASAIVTM